LAHWLTNTTVLLPGMLQVCCKRQTYERSCCSRAAATSSDVAGSCTAADDLCLTVDSNTSGTATAVQQQLVQPPAYVTLVALLASARATPQHNRGNQATTQVVLHTQVSGSLLLVGLQ
jgi:hypothetical protein